MNVYLGKLQLSFGIYYLDILVLHLDVTNKCYLNDFMYFSLNVA